MEQSEEKRWEKGWGVSIHPQIILDDYHRFRNKMGDCRNDPDDLQELFEAWYRSAFMAITTRLHPETTTKQISIIQAAMDSLQVEWSRRYALMITGKIFGSPGFSK